MGLVKWHSWGVMGISMPFGSKITLRSPLPLVVMLQSPFVGKNSFSSFSMHDDFLDHAFIVLWPCKRIIPQKIFTLKVACGNRSKRDARLKYVLDLDKIDYLRVMFQYIFIVVQAPLWWFNRHPLLVHWRSVACSSRRAVVEESMSRWMATRSRSRIRWEQHALIPFW